MTTEELAQSGRLTELEAQVVALQRRLNFDTLTGCYSRQYLFDYFDRSELTDDVLILLDLDDFKSVNDHYGHRAGDELLTEIAQATMRVVADKGFVVRMAGDAFIIILFRPTEDARIALVDQISATISGVSLAIGALEVSRTASVGHVRISGPVPGREALHMADAAQMDAKSNGKNRSQPFRGRHVSVMPLRPSIDEVRLGLRRGEFSYHVQPIFRCADLSVAGHEALLRWSRPSGEVLGPAMFLDTMTAAYDDRTKPPLAAARAASEWAVLQQGGFISFNISEAFILRAAREGLDWVAEVVGNVPRESVVFELLETIVDRQTDEVAGVVSDLRKLGIRVAIDDFGIGFSTLKRLQELKVDFVKIDRQFVHGAAQSQRGHDLLTSTIEMVHRMNAQTIVEGVESQEQLDLSVAAGAHYAQGFFLARPRQTDQFA